MPKKLITPDYALKCMGHNPRKEVNKEIKILLDPTEGLFIHQKINGINLSDCDYDYDIDFRIPPEYGCGIKYIDLCDVERITQNAEVPRKVRLKINTWMGGYDYNAKHFYAVFSVPGLEYEDEGSLVHSSDMPDKSKAFEFDVTRVAKKSEWGMDPILGRKRIEVRKGQNTRGFWTLEDVRKAVKKSFKRIFGEGWVLVGQFGRTAEEEFRNYEEDSVYVREPTEINEREATKIEKEHKEAEAERFTGDSDE